MIDAKTLRAEATFSGGKRWMNCPASVALSHGAPEDPDQEWREAGNVAHEQAKIALESNMPLENINDEAVRTYVGYIRDIAGEGSLAVEHRLSALGTSGGIDCYCIRGRVAHIFDFKYGVGVRLRAEHNEQLVGYAVCVKEKHPEVTTICCHLIQPRVEGVFDDVPSITSWTLSWQTIRKWRNDFEAALLDVEKAQEIRAGSWCQFCRAIGFCPTYIAMTERAKHDQDQLHLPELEGDENNDVFAENELVLHEKALPPADILRIANLFSMRKMVERWFDKAQGFLLSQLKAGVEVPGYELGKKCSNRIWNPIMSEEELEAELIARGLPAAQVYKPRQIIPLTKAEELIDISGLTEKPEGGDTIKAIKAPAKPRKPRIKE